MKAITSVISKLTKKAIAMVALTALTVFTFVFNVAFFLYRLVAVVFAVIGILMATVEGITAGFTVEIALTLVAWICVIALRYALPHLVPYMEQWQNELLDYVLAPLRVKPPVRYTI